MLISLNKISVSTLTRMYRFDVGEGHLYLSDITEIFEQATV